MICILRLALTLMPLLSPVAWEHYLVYLMLPLCILAARVISEGNPRKQLMFVGMLLFFSVPDATYYWLTLVSSRANLAGVGNVVQDLRTIGLGILALWLVREARRT